MSRQCARSVIIFSVAALILLGFWSGRTPGICAEKSNQSTNNHKPFKPVVSAQSAVLIDAYSGRIIYEKNAFQRKPPASTTKIMTAILALELGHLDELVTISQRAGAVGEASLGLTAGDQLKLNELIKGALVRSANDACVAIAEQVGGSEAEFLVLMNQKAIVLGAYHTRFLNPHGLPKAGHYSTAYDLALVARYALHKPEFKEWVSTKYGVVEYTLPPRKKAIKNTNRLLWQYPGADGVKTGTTIEAGKCLVASATRKNRRLIAVVLNSPNRFGDASTLLEYGFNH